MVDRVNLPKYKSIHKWVPGIEEEIGQRAVSRLQGRHERRTWD